MTERITITIPPLSEHDPEAIQRAVKKALRDIDADDAMEQRRAGRTRITVRNAALGTIADITIQLSPRTVALLAAVATGALADSLIAWVDKSDAVTR